MIELTDVSFVYPNGTTAVEKVDLSIKDGEFLVVCGANGCGKSTLLRLLNGLLEPTSGRVTVDGMPTTGSPAEIRTKVGIVFQDPDHQIIGETVADDIMFGPENLGLESEEIQKRLKDALEITGLRALAERPCHLLSGGEKRRLALAGILAMEPSVLVLDEPLANLDHPGTHDVLTRLVRLKEEGRTVIIATHDVEKVVAEADRLAVMAKGRLVATAPPGGLLGDLMRYDVRPPCATFLGRNPDSWLRD